MSRQLVLAGLAAVLLALAGWALIESDLADTSATSADGTGHRLTIGPPGSMGRSTCPEYRENNPGQAYYWDMLAFRNELEAELDHCSRVLTGPLGGWVVEERSDADGSYSIAAYLPAATHSVTHDWGGFDPTLWLTCWRLQEEGTGNGTVGGSIGSSPTGRGSEGGSLEAGLWYFGPPQLQYGEPTPVRYRFGGESGSQTLLWWGHPGQAEVAVLLPPDSYRLAVDMRRAAGNVGSEDSGPMLTVQTWDGESLSRLGASQGLIEFDLLGLERAAFPVFDACEAKFQ